MHCCLSLTQDLQSESLCDEKKTHKFLTKDGQSLPSARLVSTELTSANDRPSSSINTILLMALGQFIDHDLDHVPIFSKFTKLFSSRIQKPVYHSFSG